MSILGTSYLFFNNSRRRAFMSCFLYAVESMHTAAYFFRNYQTIVKHYIIVYELLAIIYFKLSLYIVYAFICSKFDLFKPDCLCAVQINVYGSHSAEFWLYQVYTGGKSFCSTRNNSLVEFAAGSSLYVFNGCDILIT